MGLIAVEGMRFYAYHGFYKEEQIIGNYYTVDVYIECSFEQAAEDDDLFKTINYETVYLICKAEMKKKFKLIETLSARIVFGLKHQFDNIKEVKVRIRKEHPLPGETVRNSMVEVENDFVDKCPRCGRGFICYKDENCWCKNVNVHPKTQSSLQQQYRGCLCRNCLSDYSG